MNRMIRPAALAAALASGVLLLTACGGDEEAAPAKTATSAAPTPSPTETASAVEDAWEESLKESDKNREEIDRQAAAAASVDPASTETAELPDMVGMDLEAAQDLAKIYGFNYVIDEDATGQDRVQVLDHEWTVCTQDPASGTHRVEVLVTLTAVLDAESC